MRKTIAILLAGGVGSRLGSALPKQFLTIAGKSVLEHSIDAFHDSPAIDEIAIVVHPDHRHRVETLLRAQARPKVRRVIDGGRERHESTLAALRAYEGAALRLLFHDAARPAVSRRLIETVCRALDQHEAVNVVLPVTDTIIGIDEHRRMADTPDRRRLCRVQTPQGFRSEVIAEAYRHALADPNFRSTDDCGVVFRYRQSTDIALIEGEERNLKLTHPEDLILLEHHLSHPAKT